MEVNLKVIDGAKKGAKVAVKKSEFLIGRSQECHLCVGTNAVSRKHCQLSRHDNRIVVKDLGSRNGTHVNGDKIHSEVELHSGDELAVGPLKFLVTISLGIKNEKKSQVKSVADVADRAAEVGLSDIAEDDISKWLIGSGRTPVESETKTLVMDKKHEAAVAEAAREKADEIAADGESVIDDETTADDSSQTLSGAPTESNIEKHDERKSPGKLPHRPSDSETKDSREAAVEALRAFNRRR